MNARPKKPGPVPAKKAARKVAKSKPVNVQPPARRKGIPKEGLLKKAARQSTTQRKARTPAQAIKAAVVTAESAHGGAILEDLLGGASLRDVQQRTGLERHTIERMVQNFARFAPEEYRAQVEGMRGFMGSLVFDDLLYWRPKTRNPGTVTVFNKQGDSIEQIDIDTQNLAAGLYRDAKDSIIRMHGLAKQTVEISEVSTREPLTDEELRRKALTNPAVAAAAAAIGLLTES